MKDAKGYGSDAHSDGIEQIGQAPLNPTSYTRGVTAAGRFVIGQKDPRAMTNGQIAKGYKNLTLHSSADGRDLILIERTRPMTYEECTHFATLFPQGVEVTEALCIEHAAEFNWDWAAQHLLTAPALTKYKRATAIALTEYERITAPEYRRVQASTFAKLYLKG